MSMTFRRVVTGHDKDGRAVVLFDEVAPNVSSQRAGQERALIWTTPTIPVDNNGAEDGGALNVGTGLKGGTVFGIIKLDPGIAPRHHRTTTIDYGIVLAGRLGLKLDDSEVILNPGDVFVQRGTIHTWVNHGSEPCVMAVVMVDAKAVEAGGKVLGTSG